MSNDNEDMREGWAESMPESADVVGNGCVSCDTFVVMSDSTDNQEIIFGKNSDRPKGEVQEVVYLPAQSFKKGEKLKCTYIEIEQVEETLAVILSKPAWMWGAEMGANSCGVVIGNEAVWNRLSDPVKDLQPKLLGMDLLRLGLERGKSAKEALEVVVDLLLAYGQGGQCSNIVPDFSYHNSFLIADGCEAWVLETADRLWVAEKVETGVRNISNCLSVTTKIDLCSDGLFDLAKNNGWWNGVKPFNWSQVMGGNARGSLTSPDRRWVCGQRLLQDRARDKKFCIENMIEVLRDEDSGINRPGGDFPTAGSQVSTLGSNNLSPCHWFTATPVPTWATFKPFVFGDNVHSITDLTLSPKGADLQPHEREHELWSRFLRNTKIGNDIDKFKHFEMKCLEKGMNERKKSSDKVNECFDEAVKDEIEMRVN